MSTNPLLCEAIDIFTQFAQTGGHEEYVGHLDSRLDPHLEALIEAAKGQPAPPAEKSHDGASLQRAAQMAYDCLGYPTKGNIEGAIQALRPFVQEFDATPKPADTLAADASRTDREDCNAFVEWCCNGGSWSDRCTQNESWHAALAWERQQTSARLKEAETRAKNCKDEALWFAKVLKVEEAKLPSLMYSGADLKAANLAAVARERAEVLAMWDQCGGIKVSMPDRAYQLKEYSPKCSQFIEQLHARLTQPSNQSGEAK